MKRIIDRKLKQRMRRQQAREERISFVLGILVWVFIYLVYKGI